MAAQWSRQDPAIFRLHSDVLCLIFSAAMDDPDVFCQTHALALIPAITHVCRRWRAVALGHALLWTDFFWEAGDNVEAAFAFLERSRKAPLTVRIDLEQSGSGRNARDMSVFGAVSAESSRITKLILRLCPELAGRSPYSRLFDTAPFSMPELRQLYIEMRDIPSQPARPSPRLNVSSPALVYLYIGWVLPLSWGTLLSPYTTHVTLRSVEVQCGDLHQILNLAPALHTLTFVLADVVADTSPDLALLSSAAYRGTLRSLQLHYVTSQCLGSVQSVIPITAQIREAIVGTSFVNTPPELAFDYLRFGDLTNIMSLRLLPGDLSVQTASGLARSVMGTLTEQLLQRLGDLLKDHPVLSTLREVTVCISQWDEFLWLVWEADVGDALPVLERVVLFVGQDRFKSASERDIIEYDGPQIIAPRWTALDVVVDGREPPTIDLVRAFIRARGFLRSGSSGSVAVNYLTRDDKQEDDDDYRAVFIELYDAEMARVDVEPCASD